MGNDQNSKLADAMEPSDTSVATKHDDDTGDSLLQCLPCLAEAVEANNAVS
jgi:hypothetical protein